MGVAGRGWALVGVGMRVTGGPIGGDRQQNRRNRTPFLLEEEEESINFFKPF